MLILYGDLFRRESQWTKFATECICRHMTEEVVDQTWDPRVQCRSHVILITSCSLRVLNNIILILYKYYIQTVLGQRTHLTVITWTWINSRLERIHLLLCQDKEICCHSSRRHFQPLIWPIFKSNTRSLIDLTEFSKIYFWFISTVTPMSHFRRVAYGPKQKIYRYKILSSEMKITSSEI